MDQETADEANLAELVVRQEILAIYLPYISPMPPRYLPYISSGEEGAPAEGARLLALLAEVGSHSFTSWAPPAFREQTFRELSLRS